MIVRTSICFLSICLFTSLYAQTPNDSSTNSILQYITQLKSSKLQKLQKQFSRLENTLTKESAKAIGNLQKEEDNLQKQLQQKDSTAVKNNIAASAQTTYNSLLQKLQSPVLELNKQKITTYIPGADSLQTMVKFLESKTDLLKPLPTDKLAQLQSLSKQLNSLQGKMEIGNELKRFIKERKQLWKDQFNKIGAVASLKKFNKEVYYYQERLSSYKKMLNDPQLWEQQLLSIAREMPACKAFMQQNSQLAALFNIPGSSAATTGAPNPQQIGLQTRAMVQQQLSQVMQGANVNPQQYIQQQVGAAQGELNALKDKVNKVGGGSDELEMPDFKPNGQKTKSFLQRVELGFNVQSQRSSTLLPTTTDVALQAGYKLNDKSIIGIGAAYKIGWGKNINNISISSEGVGLRSFVDIKLKGSIWVAGGYELNYNQRFSSIRELDNYGAWQRSGLIGISKKYQLGKKKGNMQLLWDFLSYSQVPQTPAIKFRLGYVL